MKTQRIAIAVVCTLMAVGTASAQQVDVAEAPEDPGASRMVTTNTAFMSKKKTFQWSSLDIGLQRFDYSVSDHVEIGGTVTLPVMFFGAAPHVRFGGELAKNVRMSGGLTGGVLVPLFDDGEALFGMYGGHFALTIGTPDLYFNTGVQAYGLTSSFSGDGFLSGTHTTWAVLPNIGMGARLSEKVKFHAELHAVFAENLDAGKVWALNYGIRIHGNALYGDIGFVLPLFEDVYDTAIKYMPLGVPTLSIGYRI